MASDKLDTPAKAGGYQVLDEPVETLFARIRARWPEDVLRRSSGMVYGEQTKYVRWDVPDDYKAIELIEMCDVQFGHIACKYDRVQEYIAWILKSPNRFVFLLGDMVDAWAMWSPGRGFEQIGDPQSQVFKFCKAFAPIRHRILGCVGGNHERRAIPGFGDLGVLISAILQVPYSAGKQLVDVYFGKHQPFKVTLWHGVGGARTKGTVAQILDRFSADGDSQLYLMGHLHQPLIMPRWKERRGPNQTVKAHKCVAAIGSSFLETWNTYGEVKGYSSHDVLMPRTILERDGSWECTLK